MEEYGPKIVYMKGHNNLVVDALNILHSHVDIVENVEALWSFVPVDNNVFSVQLKDIQAK